MQHTAPYTIQLNDGTQVPLLFNSFMYREYCYKKGMELEDLFQRIGNGTAFKSKDLPDLLYYAAFTWCKYNNKECIHSDLDACLWVDELGGYNSPELVGIYKLFVARLLNVDPAVFDVLWQKVVNGEGEKEVVAAGKKKVKNH